MSAANQETNGGTMELRNYVGAAWVRSAAATFESLNPMTGATVAVAPVSDAADVDAAVRAARTAVESRVWSDLRAADRAAALGQLADALLVHERRAGELIALEMGKPIRVARGREVGGAIDRLRFFAGAARSLDGRFVGAPPSSLWDMEIPEPVGVAALIIPWNDPIDLLIRNHQRRSEHVDIVLDPAHQAALVTFLLHAGAEFLGRREPGEFHSRHESETAHVAHNVQAQQLTQPIE